ncbi:hypothetical protein N198_01500 [Helicobacter pylori UM037]|uniref:Uncharacterized protein n=1 Tax=Helicobacter pylori UM037 TaxID=1321939 RepID=A0AB33Z6R4_HELPX|nr:hypothetical protein N198_01500 [Helicobacter pylori UM037]
MISASSFRFILKILLAFLILNEKRAFDWHLKPPFILKMNFVQMA